jgi:hypothetical protein
LSSPRGLRVSLLFSIIIKCRTPAVVPFDNYSMNVCKLSSKLVTKSV